MSKDASKNGGPDAGFTQRATIDLDMNEIYLLSGLVREKITSQETVKNRCAPSCVRARTLYTNRERGGWFSFGDRGLALGRRVQLLGVQYQDRPVVQGVPQ